MLPFKSPMRKRKNFFEIHKQVGHGPSKPFVSPKLEGVDLRAGLGVLAKINCLTLQQFGPLPDTILTELPWLVRIRENNFTFC
jgi:hypothetical protein